MHETEPSAQRSTFKRFSAQLGLAQYFYQGEARCKKTLFFGSQTLEEELHVAEVKKTWN